MSLARTWLDQCVKTHSDSCPSAICTLPTRLLDVGDESHPPKLYVTHHEQGIWVALSHCWGREARFVTESRSIAERQQGMTLEAIPATFRDGILVTRRLGYQYLWIDSLCILQDSKEDWARESSQMQHYYKNAILTVATDNLTGDHEGFLDTTRPRDSKSIRIPFHTSLALEPVYVYVRKHVHLPGYQNDSAPLNTRGWTLQENLLSPRTLHYAEQQIIFECQKYSVTESDITPRGTSDADVFSTIKRFFLRPECSRKDSTVVRYPTMAKYYDPLFRWYQILIEYYKRYLTFEDDRFAAISGLAREISQQSKMTYKAGIWVEDFHLGLLWNVSCRGLSPRNYRAPSWSWASLDINMDWGQNIDPVFDLYFGPKNHEAVYREAELLEMDVQLADGDPYGRLLSGSLRLKGRWLPYRLWRGKTPTYFATFWRKPMSHGNLRPWGRREPDGRDQLICSFDEDVEDESESESSGTSDGQVDEPDAEESDARPSSENLPLEHDVSSRSEKSSSTLELEEEDKEAPHSWDAAILDEVSMLQIAKYTSKSGEDELSVFYALLLRPVMGQEAHFRRVGLADIPDVDALAVDGWESKNCTII